MRCRLGLLLSLLWLFPFPANGQTSTRGETLYTTQVRFTAENIPILSVGIMDGQDRIQFTAGGPLRILPDGPDGMSVLPPGARTWTARLEANTTSAVVHYRIQIDDLPSGDLEKLQAARRSWQERGVTVRPKEFGSVFGFFGKVMDTRRIALTTEHVYEDRDAAEQASAQIARQHSVDTRVIPVLKERPHGTIVLTDGRTTIQSNDAIWFEPVRNDGSILVRRVEHGRGFRWHGHEDRRYRGILYVTVDRAGKLAIGNMLNSETLLRGLVPTEIFPSAPQAALRAQAVAARGELLAKLGHRHLADPYQICSDVHCQAYTGTRREDPRTDRAIEATSGRMLFHNHQLVDTVYSASCGGHTEHNDLVWGTTPDETLRGRPDGNVSLGEPTEDAVRAWVTGRPASYCGTTSYGASSFRWVDQVQSSEVRQSLQGQGIELGPIQAMRVLQRGVSGRAISLEISDRSGRSTTVNGELRIRRLLGGLKSALFVIEADTSEGSPPRSFRFIGGGFGHGVGMCQTGAIGMAEASKSFDEILRAYYLDSSIERIY